MNDLYRHELRLWMNLFLPSVKLVRKTRVVSKLRRVYDWPQTPLERVACCPRADAQRVAELKHLERTVDPFYLRQAIERKFDRLYKWANRCWSPEPVRATAAKQTRRANGCGKAAAWKPKDRVPTPLGNPAKSAGFPISHSPGGDGRSVASQMSRNPSRKLHS
jgi:hypothetical protein